ncbi:MAG: sulfurtransferase [Proteobacteria bacterium]|nr:sulfurtransferase [Pseudomonadota bacterium]
MRNTRTVNRNRIVVAALFLIFTLSFVWNAIAEETHPHIITTEWLSANMKRLDIRIIDIREKVTDYWQAHIPGAVYINPEALRLSDRGVPVKLMPPEALEIMLGKMGVSRMMKVVVYGEQSDYKAAYLIWALDYLGQSFSGMLDGGFSKWQQEKRPVVTQDYPRARAAAYSIFNLHEQWRAPLRAVKAAAENNSSVIVDVRPLEFYTGEKGFWKRKGHIKGAVHHFWGDDLKADGTLKSKEELKQAYEKIGVTPDKNIIVYCGQGQMSAHTYFVLKYMLSCFKVRNYDGGFNEWSSIAELPVVTGQK